MPRPKGAGKTDPRFGRLSSRTLDELAEDSARLDRFIRRSERLMTMAMKSAIKDGAFSMGPTGPAGPPECLNLVQVAESMARIHKTIAEIRERRQKTEGAVVALMHGLEDREAGVDVDEEKRGPVQIIVKYANGVEPGGNGNPPK
jgi:hypothetical protein